MTPVPSVPPDRLAPVTDQLRLAVATYLAWFKGSHISGSGQASAPMAAR